MDSFTSMMAAMLPAAQRWQSSVQCLIETQADLPGEVLHPSKSDGSCSDNPSGPHHRLPASRGMDGTSGPASIITMALCTDMLH